MVFGEFLVVKTRPDKNNLQFITNFTGAKIHLCPGWLAGARAKFPLPLWGRRLWESAVKDQYEWQVMLNISKL